MQAGIGKEKIIFPKSLFPIEKFYGIHDDLYTRVIYLKQEHDFLIVSLELTSLRDYVIDFLKEIIHKNFSINKSSIWINVTHTFTAPHFRSKDKLLDTQIREKNDVLMKCLKYAIVKAIEQAIQSLEPVDLYIGKGMSNVNVNRDIETENGWWIGKNPKRYSCRTINAVKFVNSMNRTLATLFTYDIRSSILENAKSIDCKKYISSDLIGYVCQQLEQFEEGSLAIYLLGGAADQSPIETADTYEEGYGMIERLGKQLAEDITRINYTKNEIKEDFFFREKNIRCVQQEKIDFNKLMPTTNYLFKRTGFKDTPIQIVSCQNIAWIGIKPEISSRMAEYIRNNSVYDMIFFITMVNGGDKYMPDEEAYAKIMYEALNSSYYRGSSELMKEEITELLEETRRGEKICV